MREYKDTWSWRCECGLEVSVGVVGYGNTDTVSVVHCPICARAEPTGSLGHVKHKTVPEEVLSSSAGITARVVPGSMTRDDIMDAMAALTTAGVDLKTEV